MIFLLSAQKMSRLLLIMIHTNKGPVLAGIIMVELENSIIPKLNTHSRFWKRYVDDTLTIVTDGSSNHVLQQLNSIHPNIHFTFELGKSNTEKILPFTYKLL